MRSSTVRTPSVHVAAPTISLRDTVRYLATDVQRAGGYVTELSRPGSGVLRTLSVILTPGVLCCFLYRLSHWLYCRRLLPLARGLAWVNYVVHKAAISPASRIGPGVYMPHPAGVTFQGHAGAGLTLYPRATVVPSSIRRWDAAPDDRDCPCLGENVTVGAFSVVSGRVSVGSGSSIAVATTSVDDVAARTIAVRRRVRTTPEAIAVATAHSPAVGEESA